MQLLSLEQVEEAFHAWRQGRTHIREAMPQRLWDMVVQLIPHYPRSLICRRLKLSGRQYKRTLICSDQHSPKIPEFVLAQASATTPTQPFSFSLTLTIQGEHRKLIMNIPSVELSQVLPHLGTLL